MIEQDTTTVNETAAAIAAAMSEPWTTRTGVWNHDDAFLCGPNGEQIHFMVGQYRVPTGRVELSGSLENGLYQQMPYGEKIPSITVTLSKSPEQIARDIERRLLPEFRRIRNLVLERKARDDAAELARKELAEKLAAALGAERQGDGWNTSNLYVGHYGDPLSGTVNVRSATADVEFNLRVSPTLAVKLAEAIASLRREEAS